MEFTGYLSDVTCATKGAPFDSKTNPEKHTVACLKGCMDSGFGILRQGKSGKYFFTKFDKKGNELAKNLLEATKKTDNMKIKVMGTKSMHMIKVESINEVD
jgi:hypothetical protein